LLDGAQVLDGARVGRGSTVAAGATVTGVVRANATVCEGGSVGASDVVGRGETWPLSGCSIEIVDNAGVREWSDGTFATSCETYRRPPGSTHVYAGLTGDSVYRVDPTGSAPFNVYCDMTTDTGGWTLVSQAVPTTNTSLTLCNSAVVGTLELDAQSVSAPAKLSDANIEALWSTGSDREILQKTDADNITPGTATFDTSCSINFNNSESWYSDSSSTLPKLENPSATCFVGTLGDNSVDAAQYSPGISCGYAYRIDTDKYFMHTVASSYQGGTCSTATAGRSWNGVWNYGCNMAKTFVR
jgi:hypothetical protein